MSGKFDVFALFPAPIVHVEVPESATFNAERISVAFNLGV